MQWALSILTVVAYATLPLGSASFEHELVPTLVVGLVYAVLAIGGFRWVQRRGRAFAVVYVGVQLPLGFVLFSLSGAAVGAVLLLVVLVSQSVLLLPLPAAAAVAAVIPLIHVEMEWPDGLREGLNTLAVTAFAIVITELLVREQRARAELADANERLRGYAAQAEQLATTQERNRVARDIHDGLGHHLTVVQMLLQAARAVIHTADTERLDAMLAKAQDQSREALAEVRRSVAALREPRSAPLVDALRALAREASEAGVPTGLEIHGPARAVRVEVEESLFRAAQEGLTNVRKHADATAATVVLDYGSVDLVRLEVRDDGRGLLEDPGNGFGLVGLRERVTGLGGHVSVDSAGHGLTLTVEVPG
ncbi:two-component sensor histidine kinase [Saccharothrix sp. ALI-22-I]|uniref:sensor histidine kinase n=1 Tax=Saccharothrix sp. ALI-22-I TaxID=1933778 RepID=UPI00097C3FA3|nr:sensor histidine kinase [Saccharothrix sp. ALI-22-I]ONI84689.1 two-component sensor histidine kinase [Saccharothrix sp. ALI-22-I]